MEWKIDCPKTNFTSYVKYYKIYFSTFIQLAFVDLKIKVILPAKMSLFGNSKEMQFRTSKLQQKPQASPTNKGEESFMEKKEVGKGSFE